MLSPDGGIRLPFGSIWKFKCVRCASRDGEVIDFGLGPDVGTCTPFCNILKFKFMWCAWGSGGECIGTFGFLLGNDGGVETPFETILKPWSPKTRGKNK